MPVVERYGAPHEQLDLPGRHYLNGNVGPDAFGGGIAAGLGDLGQGFQQASDVQAEIAQKQAMIGLDAQVSNVAAAYHKEATDALVDYTTNAKGYEAVNQQPAVQKKLADLRSKYAGQLQAPAAQQMFAQQANSADVGFNQLIVGHAAGQKFDADQQGFASKGANAQQDFVLSVGTPAGDLAMQSALDATVAGLEHQGLTQGPGGGEILRRAVATAKSGLYTAAIKARLDKSDTGPTEAYDLLQKHSGDILPTDYAALSGMVNQQLIATKAVEIGLAANGQGPGGVPLNGAAAPVNVSGPIADKIRAEAQAQGVDANKALRIAQIESGIQNIHTRTKGATSAGVFQFNDATWAAMGGSAADRNDIDAQVKQGIALIKQNDAALRAKLGREPTDAESYLAHQQGVTGALGLLSAPREVGAVAALEGVGVSHKTALASIVNNGGSADMTAGDFLDRLAGKVTGAAVRGQPMGGGAAPAQGQPDAATGDGEPSLEQVRATAAAYAQAHYPNMPMMAKAADTQAIIEYRRRQAEDRQTRSQAWGELQPFIQQSANWADVPADLKARLSATQQTAAMRLLSNGGYAKQSDPTVLAGLHQMMTANPDGFASMDLTKYAPQLEQGHYSQFLHDQDAIRQNSGMFKERQITVNAVMSESKALLISAGINPKKDMNTVAQFQSRMLTWAQTYQAQSGKPPDAKAIHDQADAMLLRGWDQSPTDRGSFVSGPRVYAFQAPTTHAFQYDIPDKIRDQLVDTIKTKYRRAPQPGEVAALYRALHAEGGAR